MTRDEIMKIIKEKNVNFFRLQFVDIFGFLKNIAIPKSQIEKALDGKIMFDGSSIEGFVRINESDMYLKPDYDTFVVMPWREKDGNNAARIICDVYMPDGTPFIGCPRNNLKRILADAKAMGYTMNVGTECEFFLFRRDEDGLPTTITDDVTGYFDVEPDDSGIDCRRKIIRTLEAMGFEIEASHHEVAEGQHEINFKYADALTCADNTVTFKWVVRSIAAEFGLHATFMPKPVFGINGSGMHTNQSLFKLDGTNAFFDDARSAAVERNRLSIHCRHHEKRQGLLPRSPIRWSTPTNGWLPVTRLRSMWPGLPPTAPPSSASRPPAAWAPGPRCAVRIRPATPIWPLP